MDPELELDTCPNCGAPTVAGEDPNGIRCWTCTSCETVVLDGPAAEWRNGTYLANTVQLFVDGNQIGAMIGKDPVQGMAGYGSSVHEALRDLADNLADNLVENAVWIEVCRPRQPAPRAEATQQRIRCPEMFG